MSLEMLQPFLAGALAVFVTPLLISGWSKLFPPAESSPYDRLSRDELHHRNNWIDVVASGLTGVGVIFPFGLDAYYDNPTNPFLLLGLMFGFMVILPTAFISAVTLPRGIKRFEAFWRFYELKHGVGLRGVFVVYIILGIIGLYSGYKLAF